MSRATSKDLYKEPCPVCGKYYYPSGMDKHIKAKHVEEWERKEKELQKETNCEICGKVVTLKALNSHLNSKHKFGMFSKKKGMPCVKSRVEQECMCCGGMKFGTYVYGTNPKQAKRICPPCRKKVFKYASSDKDALEYSTFTAFETNRRKH